MALRAPIVAGFKAGVEGLTGIGVIWGFTSVFRHLPSLFLLLLETSPLTISYQKAQRNAGASRRETKIFRLESSFEQDTCFALVKTTYNALIIPQRNQYPAILPSFHPPHSRQPLYTDPAQIHKSFISVSFRGYSLLVLYQTSTI